VLGVELALGVWSAGRAGGDLAGCQLRRLLVMLALVMT
jgi:hypothetical protein